MSHLRARQRLSQGTKPCSAVVRVIHCQPRITMNSRGEAYHTVVEDTSDRRSLIYHVVDNVVVAQDRDTAVIFVLSVLFSDNPDIGVFTAVRSVEHDLLFERIMFNYVLNPALMAEVGLELGPSAQNIILIWRAYPLGDQRLVARDLVEEWRSCKIE